MRRGLEGVLIRCDLVQGGELILAVAHIVSVRSGSTEDSVLVETVATSTAIGDDTGPWAIKGSVADFLARLERI